MKGKVLASRCACSKAHGLFNVLFLQHESEGDHREHETGPGIRFAGKLQLSQRSVPGPAGANQEVYVHGARQRRPAEVAAGNHDDRRPAGAGRNLPVPHVCFSLCSLSCGKKLTKRLNMFGT